VKTKSFVFFILSVLLIEISLQFFYRARNGDFLFRRAALPIFDADPDRHYKLLPHLSYRHRTNEFDVTYFTNGQGIRTDRSRADFDAQKGEDVYRILFLGPSFAFGWGNSYEDTYAALIGKGISVPGKRVEVMNLGTPAQPMAYQLRWFEKSGYRFGPDLIVQTLYGDIRKIAAMGIQDKGKLPVVLNGRLYHSQPSAFDWLRGFLKNSAVVFYGWYVYQSFLAKTPAPAGLGEEFESSRETRAEHVAPALKQYVSRIHRALGREIPVIFLYIPYSYVVNARDLSRWQHLAYEPPQKIMEFHAPLAAALAAEGFYYLDATDALAAGNTGSRMYYFLDIHLTPEGNRVVAERAVPLIQRALEDAASPVESRRSQDSQG